MNTKLTVYNPVPNEFQGKDYVIKITIRNGPLLRAMRVRGFGSVAELARACKIPVTFLYSLFTLKAIPLTKDGNWKPNVLKLAEMLQLPPDCLFPEQHVEAALPRNSFEVEATPSELISISDRTITQETPLELLEQSESSKIIEATLQQVLSPREERAIRSYFGFNDVNTTTETLETVATEFGVSRERLRQILGKAFRKLNGNNPAAVTFRKHFEQFKRFEKPQPKTHYVGNFELPKKKPNPKKKRSTTSQPRDVGSRQQPQYGHSPRPNAKA